MENLGPNIGYRPEDRERYERLLSFLNISKRILRRRSELGLSQEALGKMAGSNQAKISDIELMKGNPRLKTLDNIARNLGLVVDLVPMESVALPKSITQQPFFTEHAPRVVARAAERLVTAGSRSDADIEWSPPFQVG